MARKRKDYLVLDIETVPDSVRWSRPEPGGGGPQAGPYTDWFPPTWAHRIIVIGCLWLDEDYKLKKLGVVGDRGDEAHILDDFSRFIDKNRPILVTYNGRTFDLPVIAVRSLHHAVPMRWYYQERGLRYRYSEEGHIDLCDWIADHGATRSMSLDALAKLIGLPGKVGVDGSQIEGLYKAGQLEAIQNYCLADVAQTALLFLRFRLLQGLLAPAAYREAARVLEADLRADARLAALASAWSVETAETAAPAAAPPEGGAGPDEG